jgi:hypothetical protein
MNKEPNNDFGAWQITAGAELPNEARDFVFVIGWAQVA